MRFCKNKKKTAEKQIICNISLGTNQCTTATLASRQCGYRPKDPPRNGLRRALMQPRYRAANGYCRGRECRARRADSHLAFDVTLAADTYDRVAVVATCIVVELSAAMFAFDLVSCSHS